MVSYCLNCAKEIWFGNIRGEDFCSEECEQEWEEKHPAYVLKEEPDRCHVCGSKNRKNVTKKEQVLSVGNVLTNDPFKPTRVVIENFLCTECGHEGQNFFIGEKAKISEK